MSRRKDIPALYELISSERRGTGPISHSQTPAADIPRPGHHGPAVNAQSPEAHAFDPGSPRSVRIPFGFLMVAVGAAIVLIVLAYAVGQSQGYKQAHEEISTRRTPTTDPSREPTGTSLDGSGDGGSPTSNTGLENLGAIQQDPVPGPAAGDADPPREQPQTPDRNEDTRVPGLNYLIVEQFDAKEADKVADFLSGQGIDVMVLPTKNRGLYQVIARKGFEGSELDARTEFERRVVRLGKDWKSKQGGSKNFDLSYYALKK